MEPAILLETETVTETAAIYDEPNSEGTWAVSRLPINAETLNFALMADASGIEFESAESVETKVDAIAKMAEAIAEDSELCALEGLDIPEFTRDIGTTTLDNERCETMDILVEKVEDDDVVVESAALDAVIATETLSDKDAVESYVMDEIDVEECFAEEYEEDASLIESVVEVEQEVLPVIDLRVPPMESVFTETEDSGTEHDENGEMLTALDEEVAGIEKNIHEGKIPDSDTAEWVVPCEVQSMQEPIEVDVPVATMIDVMPAVAARYTCRFRCRKPGGLLRGPILSFYCKFICQRGNY